MIHNVGWSKSEDERVSIDQLRHADSLNGSSNNADKIAEALHDEQFALNLLMQRCSKTESEIRTLYDQERILSAQEALEFGLIDEIV